MASKSQGDPTQKTGALRRPRSQWRSQFLDTLAETSNVSQAARAAAITPSRAYKMRRADAGFRQDWYAALLEGYEHLELETLHRLRMGTAKDDNRFDIANALRLLMLHKDTVARERALRDADDEDSVLATLSAKINAMRAREAEVQQMLAAAPDEEIARD